MTEDPAPFFSSAIKRSGFVTVVGRPNVGKSTLINRVVGQKVAIVTDKPQTTRNRILAIANVDDAQIVFYDTPGIHKPMHRMNQVMVDVARETLSKVDVVLLVADMTQAFGHGDTHVLRLLQHVKKPVLLAINKVDMVAKENVLPVIAEYSGRHAFEEIVPISAKDGDNVDRLVELLAARLPEGPALFPDEMLTDAPERFFVCEIIREKILNSTHEEIPYATAVTIDRWADSEGLIRIEASILVERASQKGILVGKNGSMIKRIGTDARKEIEPFLGQKIFLGLHVKVHGDWRESPRVLGELGIEKQ